MRLPRMTTRRMMAAVAVVALGLGGGPAIRDLCSYCKQRAAPHSLMSGLCGNEETLFEGRALTCLNWAVADVPWDREGAEADTLKLCPDQWEAPDRGSWLEQAAGWTRAAVKARRAAQRHHRVAQAYELWGAVNLLSALMDADNGGFWATLCSMLVLLGLWLCSRPGRRRIERSAHESSPA